VRSSSWTNWRKDSPDREQHWVRPEILASDPPKFWTVYSTLTSALSALLRGFGVSYTVKSRLLF
jgi:hypothetical protein